MGVPDTDFKTCVMKNAGEERLLHVIGQNLAVLEKIIDYNVQNDIRLFRISSDIIPFGSSPVNTLVWQDIFEPELTRIGDKIRAAGMRVSMHPGQYTVLNSPIGDVVARAVEDLLYHAKFLDALKTGPEHKIILHIGGVYGDREEAVRRFVFEYERLDSTIKRRIVIENDEKSYNTCEVLEIAHRVGAPAVFDNLHHAINPCHDAGTDAGWIRACAATWKPQDGRQKIHYSQQAPGKKPGAHADSIRIDEFLAFYETVQGENIDIMLEVKDKNLSAVKCVNCTSVSTRLFRLELDWSRYKYLILEKAPAIYQDIRKLLKNRETYLGIEFYHLVETALQSEISVGNAVNAAEHVWGYFKKLASEDEKTRFFRRLEAFERGEAGQSSYKKYLLNLAYKYEQQYLIDSLYFYI